MAQQLGPKSFKTLSRGLLIALVISIALVSYDIAIPKGRSSSKNWHFVLAHPTILLHIVISVVILIVAVLLVVKSIQSHHRAWVVVSLLGFVCIVLAFGSGENYVSTLSNGSLSAMGLGWFGAALAYRAGWYLGRKAEIRARDRAGDGSVLPEAAGDHKSQEAGVPEPVRPRTT